MCSQWIKILFSLTLLSLLESKYKSLCVFIFFFFFTQYLDSLVPLFPAFHRRDATERNISPVRVTNVRGIPTAVTVQVYNAMPVVSNFVCDCSVVDPGGKVGARIRCSVDPVNVTLAVSKLDRCLSGSGCGKQKDNGLERCHIRNVHTLSRA